MFMCSSTYDMPGSSSNGHHQRLSTSSSLEDQPPSFSSDFCSPQDVNQSFNAFLSSSTDVPIHHALSLSSFENNNDITCHQLKVEPSIDASYQQQQQQSQTQLFQQSQQQQALLGLQQTPHHSGLLMQSSLGSMGSSNGSIIPPISSLHRHMPLPASHMSANNGDLVGGSSGHDLLGSSILTPPIMLPQPNASSSIAATSNSVMDLMVSTPTSLSNHHSHHRDPGEPPPGHFGAKDGMVNASNASTVMTNGGCSILDTRHSNLINNNGNRVLGNEAGSGGMIPPYNPLAAAACAAAAAALCTPHTNDMRLNGNTGCSSVGSMQPVDLTHQQHHHQSAHQHPTHHPHHHHNQQSLMLPSVMMAPQQHSTSSSTSAASMSVNSYHHQQHSQQTSHTLSPMTGPMASDWAFVDHSSSRCLAASTPVTSACPPSDHHMPPVPTSVDPLSRSFLSGSNGFSSPSTNCIPSHPEDGPRERKMARSQILSTTPSSAASGVIGRCGNDEEPLLTNLESWKMVHGEPMEMEVNGGSSEEPSCMVSTAPSIVSVMPVTVASHTGMHMGAPILSRQGSVDELITHCLSGETENMLSDPDLWQILSTEPNVDHNAHVMEDHDGVKIKRSLSTDPICQQQLHLLTASRTSPSHLPVSSMAPSTPSQHSDAYTPSPTSSLPSYCGDGPLGSSLPSSIITSHFWKYNAQSKGPKARRMDLRDPGASKDSKLSPYRLVEFRDPVQDRNDLIHCTKIRKGDGNDITPNPLKLHKMGLELHRLNGQIQAVVSTTEGDRVKKEKNRIASQSCRLKRKAYNEANKIKLYGLGLEHSELLDVLNHVKKELGRRVALVERRRRRLAGGEENRDPAGLGDSNDCLTMSELIRSARRELNKTRVSGRSDLYVGEVLEEVWRQENASAAVASSGPSVSLPQGPCAPPPSLPTPSLLTPSSHPPPADLGLIRPPD